jgi:hypothetical protein
MNLVLIRNIPKEKAYELLETSKHNVQSFKPEIMKKALQYGDGNEYVCLFSSADKQNCLVMASITPKYGPTNGCYYLHEMTEFQKGYGKIMVQMLCKNLKKTWF